MNAAGKHSRKMSTGLPPGSTAELKPGSHAGAVIDAMPLTKRVMETEKGFQRAIIELAGVLQWLHYHTWQSIHSPQGFPDLVLVRPPYVILAEVKTEKGRVSRAQWVWYNRLRQCPGVEVYLWRPSHWDYIVGRLQGNTSLGDLLRERSWTH